jgi:protein SHQ1
VLSVLFAAAYDARSTHGEPTAESAWTLCALVPAFGALDAPPYAPVPGAPAPPRAATAWPEQDPALLAPTLAASYRRALAYPLFRHWALADACRADAGALLRRGKRPVVRALLGAKALLDAHDAYYVYAKVWLDDLAAWAAAQARCVATRGAR